MSSVAPATLRGRMWQRVKNHPVITRAAISAGTGIATLGAHHAVQFQDISYYSSEAAWGIGLGLTTVFPALLGIKALRPRVTSIWKKIPVSLKLAAVPVATTGIVAGLYAGAEAITHTLYSISQAAQIGAVFGADLGVILSVLYSVYLGIQAGRKAITPMDSKYQKAKRVGLAILKYSGLTAGCGFVALSTMVMLTMFGWPFGITFVLTGVFILFAIVAIEMTRFLGSERWKAWTADDVRRPVAVPAAEPAGRVAELTGEVERLRGENAGLAVERDSLRGRLEEEAARAARVAGLDRDLQARQAELDRATRKIFELRTALNLTEASLAEAREQIEALGGDRAMLREEVGRLEKTIIRLNEQLEKLAEALEAAQAEADDMKKVVDRIRYAKDPDAPVEIAVLGRGGMGVVTKCYDPGRQKFMVVKELFDFAVIPRARLEQNLGSNFASTINGILRERPGSADQYEFLPSIRSADDIQPADRKARKALVQIWEEARDITVEARKRFENEQRALDRVKHPNVVEGYGRIGKKIAMELIRGRTLTAELMRESKTPVARALAVAKQVVRGLKAFEEADMAHRDLKPDNIMLVAGRGPEDEAWVKLVDLGAAKLPAVAAHETIAGYLAPGTLDYMAPERFDAERPEEERADIRSDIWAAGVILYQMLCGKVPFPSSGTPANALLTQYRLVSQASLPDIRREVPALPEAIQDLLERMMAKKVDDRPDPDAVIASIERIEATL